MTDEEIKSLFEASWASHGDRAIRFARMVEARVKEEVGLVSPNGYCRPCAGMGNTPGGDRCTVCGGTGRG